MSRNNVVVIHVGSRGNRFLLEVLVELEDQTRMSYLDRRRADFLVLLQDRINVLLLGNLEKGHALDVLRRRG
jgi:hypothetical protein